MSDKQPSEKPYFAPPATEEERAARVDRGTEWGEDAQAIQRQAGLGSYGPEPTDQEARENALIRTLERVDAEVASLRSWVFGLYGVVFGLGAAVMWLSLR